jgi:hypothetical protein
MNSASIVVKESQLPIFKLCLKAADELETTTTAAAAAVAPIAALEAAVAAAEEQVKAQEPLVAAAVKGVVPPSSEKEKAFSLLLVEVVAEDQLRYARDSAESWLTDPRSRNEFDLLYFCPFRGVSDENKMRMRDAYKEMRREAAYASSGYADATARAKRPLTDAINTLRGKQSALASASDTLTRLAGDTLSRQRALDTALSYIPEGLRQLSTIENMVCILSGDTPDGWVPPSDLGEAGAESLAYADYLAVVRGELEFPTMEETTSRYGVTDEGFNFFTLVDSEGVRIAFILDVTGKSDHVHLRENFAESGGYAWIDTVIPAAFRYKKVSGERLTRRSITPWSPDGTTPPIDVKTQQSRIDNYLRKWTLDLRSVLLYGEFNSSKTTFASAYLTDVITERLALNRKWNNQFSSDRFHPCVWRVNLNDWLDSYLAWRTRDYTDSTIQRTHLTAQDIKSICTEQGLRPVVWIEELDKFQPTPTNKNWVHTLVDQVYLMNGLIVATTNTPLPKLRTLLGEGIVGRLDGSRDGREKFVELNFSRPKSK